MRISPPSQHGESFHVLFPWDISSRKDCSHDGGAHTPLRQFAAFSNTHYVLNSITAATTLMPKQSLLCSLTSQFGDDWQGYLIMQTVQAACGTSTLVLLTSCQSWRWVRRCIQWRVNYIKVNIQPLGSPVVSVPRRDYFQCYFQAELPHKLTFSTSAFLLC